MSHTQCDNNCIKCCNSSFLLQNVERKDMFCFLESFINGKEIKAVVSIRNSNLISIELNREKLILVQKFFQTCISEIRKIYFEKLLNFVKGFDKPIIYIAFKSSGFQLARKSYFQILISKNVQTRKGIMISQILT